MLQKKRKIFKKLFLFSAASFAVLFVFTVFGFFYLSKDLPSVEQITNRQVIQSTKIYDRTGKVLLYEISGGQKRTVIPFEEIPQFIKDATIAVEDENFYNNPGVDWRGILRAIFRNLKSGDLTAQGGSTITQQLAKKAFLTDDKTITRKIRELILARQLTTHYSKDEILTLYLNEIPYGATAYGIEAASLSFFGKQAKELNLAEAALLAALPRAPSYYSPFGNHTEDLMNRQRYILEKMHDLGKIDKEQLDHALSTKLVYVPQSQGMLAPHFVITVQDYLAQKYGEDLVRTGGLRVVTTIDYDLQTLAEKSVLEGAEQNQKLYEGYNAALVAQDPKTGQILALVGSRDYFASSSLPAGCVSGKTCKFEPNFSVATQGLRQPGSALKPFAYLTSFAKGYTPDTILFDTPTEFVPNNPECPSDPDFSDEKKECFHPENFDEQFRGPVTLRRGLAQSINIPSVKTLYLAGLLDVLETVKNFGITTLDEPNRYGLSLVLGGGEVKLVELAGAYSVLAQEGVRHTQSMILEVKDSKGEILESYKDQSQIVFDQNTVRLVNDILTDVTERAGLFQGSLGLTVFPDYEVALKTGTSNDYRDAWAMGYSPSLVAGVWAGNNDNSPMQRHGSSLLAAIPIWHAFMAEALKKFPPGETFPSPEPVQVQKPVLRGDYLANNQVHSILYYVDRRNPDGSPPQDPANDPQFSNWEFSVLKWAKEHISDFERNYNVGGSQGISGIPQIQIKQPAPGTFIKSGEIQIRASILSALEIVKIRVLFNGALLQEFSGLFGSRPEFVWSFTPPNPQLQNLLTLEAIDQSNRVGRVETILYK